MAAEQPHLFAPPEAVGRLRERQLLVYEFVRDHPAGVSADEVGAAIHHHRGRHGPDVRCQWCANEGTSVLLSLRSEKNGRLVKRRRGDGLWVLREAQAAVSASLATEGGYDPSTAEIPY